MTDDIELQALCEKKLAQIRKKYEDIEVEQRTAFNIFTILRNRGEEVGLHSKFLGTLLNPNAGHKSNLFQKLFIEHIVNAMFSSRPIPLNQEFDCDIELSVSRSTESKEDIEDNKKTNRDQIDICMRSKDFTIIIENKIYARDQKNQLQRYFEVAKKWNVSEKNIFILYLNLFGHDISDFGRGRLCKEDGDYQVISYKEHIINWLKKCEEVGEHEHIKQTIIQYRRLIERLTGQEHKMEIRELLRNNDNAKLIHDANKQIEPLMLEVQRGVWEELYEQLKTCGYEFSPMANTANEKIESLELLNQKFTSKYFQKGATWDYGLRRKLGKLGSCTIYVTILVHQRILFGLRAVKSDAWVQNSDEDLKALGAYILQKNDKKIEPKSKGTWIGGLFCPTRMVDFYDFDRNGSNLFDLVKPDKRQQWVKETSEEISEFIEYCNKFSFDSE